MNGISAASATAFAQAANQSGASMQIAASLLKGMNKEAQYMVDKLLPTPPPATSSRLNIQA